MSNEQQITQLYIGYFGRAADPAGLNFWVGQANAGGAIIDIANSFAASGEYLGIYGGLANAQLLDQIYANLFDRLPDDAGRAYWLNALDIGFPISEFVLAVMNGAQGNDRLVLENTTIVAADWTSRTPEPFDITAAHEAIDSINEAQPVTGNGITVNIADPALLPWQNEIDASIKAAWHQWEIHFDNQSQIQIDVGYAPIEGGGIIASAAPRMEVVLASGYTQSGALQEIITGLDPNGAMADGFINLHMDPAYLFSAFNMTSVFAHEIGHVLAYRTQINNPNAEHRTNYDGFISASGGSLHFDGPQTMAAYGGPVPIPRLGAFNDFAHVDDPSLLMFPFFSGFETRTVGVIDLAVLADLGASVT